MQFTNIHTVAVAAALVAVFAGVWLWKHRRQYLAYGTFSAASIAIALLLLLPDRSSTVEHDFASVTLAAGYVDFDSPDVTTYPASNQTQQRTLPSVPAMIAQLENRLAAEPRDAKGWSLLAQSYAYVGNLSGIESAITSAVQLGIDENTLRSQVAIVETDHPLR